MRVAIDVTPILPGGECGGVKGFVLELLRGFGERATSMSFILLTAHYNDDAFKEFDKFGMKRICVLKDPSGKSPSSWWQFLERALTRIAPGVRPGLLARHNVSVLFCPMTAPIYHEAGIPTVSLICDLQHVSYPFFFSRQELAQRNAFYARLRRVVDQVVCISAYTGEAVLRELSLSADAITSIPISLRPKSAAFSADFGVSVLEKYGLRGKTFCIYPANTWPHKNHKMLLVAFGLFARQHPEHDLHLVLTGTAITDTLVFDNAIKQMRLEGKVFFLGYLSEEELSVLWHRSHFLIYPSLFEGFGIPLLEAMTYGKAILASNVTSIPEVAGDAAIYFDPRRPEEIAHSLRRIMEDGSLRDALVAKGRERLRSYDFDNMVDKYLSLFRKTSERGITMRVPEVSGIYGDGWAGDRIRIAFPDSRHKRLFSIEGFIPNGHPRDRMEIKVKSSFGERIKRRVLNKHETLMLNEVIPETQGVLEIRISKGFIPGNGDRRRLTLRVRSASLSEEDSGAKLYEFPG